MRISKVFEGPAFACLWCAASAPGPLALALCVHRSHLAVQREH